MQELRADLAAAKADQGANARLREEMEGLRAQVTALQSRGWRWVWQGAVAGVGGGLCFATQPV